MLGSFALPLSPGRLAAAAAVLAAAGLAAGKLPLLEVPGYELGLLGSLLAALLGGPLGIAAARREIRREPPSALRAFASATAVLVALQAALSGAVLARAALASPCSPLAGAAFVPVLALPSALAASALGVAAGLAARGRPLPALALYSTAALVSLGAALADAYAGPAAYVLDHLLGFWPGPIYDEALRLEPRLLGFRLGTLAWAAALVAGSDLALRLAARRPARRAAAALILAAACGAGARAVMAARGDLASRQRIAAELGGRHLGERCQLWYPAEKPPAEVERLVRDCEFEAEDLAAALGVDRPQRVTVFLYRDEAEKRRLVGAGRTDFTKPWLREAHLTDAPSPHPSLRHELAHALSGAFARGPLRLPARGWVLVRAGLVEGLAVAVDLPRGQWTVHQWARAMRDLGLMPGASRLIGPAGFLGAPQARAYAVAGSFLRFLLDRHGAGPVRRLYAGDSFQAAFGASLAALERDWSGFLDGVAVPEELLASAAARFRAESLFARRCAREVENLRAGAAEAVRAGRAAEAARWWRHAAAVSGDAADLRAAGDAARGGGDLSGAAQAYREALERTPPDGLALRAQVVAALGDLDWLAGRASPAAARYREALALGPDRSEARLLQAKLAALADPALAEAAGPWLLGRGDPAAALGRLVTSRAPLASYLAGRAFLARGAPRLAVGWLERAARGPLPGAALSFEAERAVAEARCASGDFDGGIAGFGALARRADREADRVRAAAAARRCAFERDRFGRPVAGPSDLGPPRIPH